MYIPAELAKIVDIKEIISPEEHNADAVYNCGTFIDPNDTSPNPKVYAVCRTTKNNLYKSKKNEPDWNAYFGLYEGSIDGRYHEISHFLSKDHLDTVKVIGKPLHCELVNLEDSRVHVDQQTGILYIGVTAVFQNAIVEKYEFYPAIMRAKFNNSVLELIDGIEIISQFGPGKNCTIVASDAFVYRKENDSHALTMIKRDEKGEWKECDIISLTAPEEWGPYKIGTVAEPIPVPEGDYKEISVMHGIKFFSTGSVSFEYGLGLMAIKRDETHEVVSNPLMTYKEFCECIIEKYGELPRQLHAFRHALYCCGQIVIQNNLYLFVSFGDRSTFQVNFGDINTLVYRVKIQEKYEDLHQQDFVKHAQKYA